MHARPDLAAQQKMVDDGSGEAEVSEMTFYCLSCILVNRTHYISVFIPQVWRLEDNELVPVERKWLGHFYGGDCYLILYKYEVNRKMHYILYMWQVGVSSSLIFSLPVHYLSKVFF